MHQDSFSKKCFYKISRFLPDKLYLSLKFHKNFGRFPDWKNPKTFSEKLQWLKIHDHNPLYPKMVDKLAAKDYVASIIGEEYIIPTLGVWDRAEDIDFDSLPDKFVLKATHDSGRVIICADKNNFDTDYAVKEMKESLKRDFYCVTREWPYKKVPKKILAEELILPKAVGSTKSDIQEKGLIDYKFFCFNGTAHCVMICIGRETGSPIFYFFDKDWNLLRYNIRGKNAPSGFTYPRPDNIGEMFTLAETLSKNLPFSRIDLYSVNNKIYFGEITLYPLSGMDPNLLDSTEHILGKLLNIESIQS